MEPQQLAGQIAGLAALDDPVRWALYQYVAGRRGDVSRDEAARAAGVSRALAGFHLDRLAAEGLLETSFRRLTGRSGPGAGRPAKLYRRAAKQFAVSLPPRSYELAARILAEALEVGGTPATSRALRKAAGRLGERIGAEVRASAPGGRARIRPTASAIEALAAAGYEPQPAPGEIRLCNCPFHALVAGHRKLVCGMNLALVGGLVRGLADPGLQAVLDPQPSSCCVVLRTRGARKSR